MAKLSRKGMSLLDWLAGQALAGLMACQSTDEMTFPLIAEKVYSAADAMLEARKKLASHD